MGCLASWLDLAEMIVLARCWLVSVALSHQMIMISRESALGRFLVLGLVKRQAHSPDQVVICSNVAM